MGHYVKHSVYAVYNTQCFQVSHAQMAQNPVFAINRFVTDSNHQLCVVVVFVRITPLTVNSICYIFSVERGVMHVTHSAVCITKKSTSAHKKSLPEKVCSSINIV